MNIEVLKTYGMSTYASAVFIALIENGAQDAQKLCELANVPSGRIYDALFELEHLAIIDVQQSRPKLYKAIKVEKAIEKIKEHFEKNKVEEEKKLELLKQDLIKKEKAPKNISDDSFFLVKRGEEGCMLQLAREMQETKKEMCLFFDSHLSITPTKKCQEFVDQLLPFIDKNKITMRLLIPDHFDVSSVKVPLKYHKKFLVRKTKTQYQTFRIHDDVVVVYKIEDPSDSLCPIASLHLYDKELVVQMRTFFEKVWKSALQIKL